MRTFTPFVAGGILTGKLEASQFYATSVVHWWTEQNKTKILPLPHMQSRSARQLCNTPNWPKTKNVFCVLSNFVSFRDRRSCPGIQRLREESPAVMASSAVWRSN